MTLRTEHLDERHLRDARAASALNHPHICSIHDIGKAECLRSGPNEEADKPAGLVPP